MMVDLPLLFGPTNTFSRLSEMENCESALKLWKSMDVIDMARYRLLSQELVGQGTAHWHLSLELAEVQWQGLGPGLLESTGNRNRLVPRASDATCKYTGLAWKHCVSPHRPVDEPDR